jgi:pSer/pThr/pTyr-binding forkhead associated (FHA) protein
VAWSELRELSYTAVDRAPLNAQLAVVSVPEPDPLQGRRVALEPLTTIGRGPGNTIQLADRGVSAQHARLVHRADRWWLEDLGSTNGTWLNGRRVERPLPVQAGDVLQVARTVLRVESR